MAVFPVQVLSDIQIGKQYFSDLNQVYLSDMNSGGCTCDTETLYDLDNILNDLVDKVEINSFDEDAMGLYNKMMEIIGGEAYVPPVVVNAIYTGTGVPTTNEQITAGLLTEYTIGEDMIVVFNNSSVLVNFIAIPPSAPIPTQFVNINNPLDAGSIGGSEDLFGAFSVVGDWQVAVTNYPISIINTYLFS